MNKFYVVGIGPGNKDYILPAANKVIEDSEVLIGGKRNIESFNLIGKEIIYITSNLSDIEGYIRNNKHKNITILVSGDTGFYSMLGFISRNFKKEEYIVIPGISSMQYMFSKIGEMWHDAYIGSVHGREFDYKSKVDKYRFVGLLTDKINTPDKIAENLIGMENIKIYVGENLSYGEEKIIIGTPEEISINQYSELNIVIVENQNLGVK